MLWVYLAAVDPWQMLADRWPTFTIIAMVVLSAASVLLGWIGKKLWNGVGHIKTLFAWGRPMVEDWFCTQRTLGESLPLLLESVQLTNAVLSSLVRDVQAAAVAPDILLVVEDKATDIILFRHHVRAWAEDHHLLIVTATRINDSVHYLRKTRVCVLDLGVPDAQQPETIQAFIGHADAHHVPVIIFSGRDNLHEYVSSAFATVQKGEFTTLIEKLNEAIEAKI